MNNNNNIGFNVPAILGNEIDYIKKAIKMRHIHGGGSFTSKCNKLFEKQLQVKKSFITTSCTHALEAASILIDIQPGDEIILPSFTFVSTANAFVLRGAKPIFVDIRKDTLNIDESLLSDCISDRTKAIIPVHYGGVSCEMDKITELIKDTDIQLIEDNAQGLFGKYKGKYLGTFGVMSTQSFHETKNITCGEGGALFINNEDFIDRAEIIMDKGTNRKNYFDGKVGYYSWVDYGSSYRPSEILSAFLYAQLEKAREVQTKRKRIWDKYRNQLNIWAQNKEVILPEIPPYCESSYHLFYMVMPSQIIRDLLIEYLKKHKIISVFHYVPLHNSEMSERFGWNSDNCPISIDISQRLIRLPLYYGLTENQSDFIIEKILNFKDI